MTIEDADRATWALAALYGASGILMPYLPLWLITQGMDQDSVSWTILGAIIARAACTFVFGSSVARLVGFGRATIMAASGACISFATIAAAPTTMVSAVLSVAGAGLLYGTMPLVEAFAINVTQAGRAEYGTLRAWGSAAFLLASFLGGVSLSVSGSVSWLPMSVAALAAALAMAMPFRTAPRRHAIGHQTVPALGSLFLLLLPALLIQASHSYYYAFGVIRWVEHGIPAWVTGTLWGTGVVAEILAFRFCSCICTRFEPTTVLAVCGAVAAARWAFLSTNPCVAIIAIVQLAHAFSFALAYSTAMVVLRNRLPPSRQADGQAVYAFSSSCVALGAGTAILPFLARSHWLDPYLVMASIAVVAALCSVLIGMRQTAVSGSEGVRVHRTGF